MLKEIQISSNKTFVTAGAQVLKVSRQFFYIRGQQIFKLISIRVTWYMTKKTLNTGFHLPLFDQYISTLYEQFHTNYFLLDKITYLFTYYSNQIKSRTR